MTRRDFLTATTAAAVLGGATPVAGKDIPVKIDRIDVFPLRYPMSGFFKFLDAGRAAVIVRIVADNGTVGWGQSIPVETWSYETFEADTIALRDYYAPRLIGHDPTGPGLGIEVDEDKIADLMESWRMKKSQHGQTGMS